MIAESYELRNGFILRFKDPETEKTFLEDLGKDNEKRVKLGTKLLIIIYFLAASVYLVAVESSYSAITSIATSWVLNMASYVGVVIIIQVSSSKYLEYVLCGSETFLLSFVLFMNMFRLKDESLINELPEGAYNRAWNNCDDDLAVHSRDAINVCVVLVLQAYFRTLARVRMTISWVVPTWLVLWFHLLGVTSRLNDGGGTRLLLLLLFVGSFLIWIVNVFNERSHRQMWALLRMRDVESIWQKELLRLVFPIVVLVESGNVESPQAFKRHLGVDVANLADLPALRNDGTSGFDVSSLVSEVESTGRPSKRSLVLHPRGAAELFRCSLYAVRPVYGTGAILGVEILETWSKKQEQIINQQIRTTSNVGENLN